MAPWPDFEATSEDQGLEDKAACIEWEQCKAEKAKYGSVKHGKSSSKRMAMLKRLKVEGDRVDRLSDLPINVKHQIQQNLLIDEAARMSVLSTVWRHVWPSIPELVFSAQFCQSMLLNTLIDIINTILSQHYGPIKTFFLNISSLPSLRHSVISEWMLFLSKNGVKDLTLHNTKNVPYRLPSFMYAIELERLYLSKCVCRLPGNFRGFHKLKFLKLNLVLVRHDETSILWMPNLLKLHFRSCQGLYHLKIYAPKLWYLNFYNIGPNTLNLDNFLDCRNLTTIIFASREHQSKVMNFTNLLSCCPQVSNIHMDTSYLKSFASGTEVERLPTRLDNVKFVRSYIDFDDEDQVSSILKILTSTPNVKDLILDVWSSEIKGGMEEDVNHFEGPAYGTQEFNKLQKLKIAAFRGLKSELLFVRFILRSAPLLLKTILLVDESVDESQYLKISEELRGFPRASPKLEIIICNYCKNKPILEQIDVVFCNISFFVKVWILLCLPSILILLLILSVIEALSAIHVAERDLV
ncbi:F-box/FBD/LRR-repeat protein At1g13570-like [Solanum verrucosum]|uniref:F-box/FBD/LRR-repeat protein At1g13570-like n=1 Tax=Solanum verrucosum TaxID=315347 RepID=UPI0020CFFFB3|nr:F-box/FBD/LRR-repeat protein At1g13570-like [Solanum verrucosum]